MTVLNMSVFTIPASKLSSIDGRTFSSQMRKKRPGSCVVLSANFKSSTSTMVYIAGIFHLASIE
jgi:hypothetical protein